VPDTKRCSPSNMCIILGGGGHASVLIDCIRSSGLKWELVVLDSDPKRWGELFMGVKILGGDEILPELLHKGAKYFVVGLGSTGNNMARKRLYEWGLSCGLEPLTVIHPSVECSEWANVGMGTVLLPGSIVNAGTEVGENVIINSGAIVEHNCVLGDHVHVATGARLAGEVQIGICAHIGAGATVIQGVSIGSNAVIGAGAVVIRDVLPGEIVAGVPARPLRKIEEPVI